MTTQPARPIPAPLIAIVSISLAVTSWASFFGAAQNAMGALHAAHGDGYSVLVLSLGHVPVIDATGLVALDNAIATLVRQGKEVVLAGPLPKHLTAALACGSRIAQRRASLPS